MSYKANQEYDEKTTEEIQVNYDQISSADRRRSRTGWSSQNTGKGV